MTRAEIVAEAKTWLGVRWRHLGRDRNGLDCIGLLVVVANHFGQKVADRDDYRRTPDGNLFRGMVEEQTDPGDLMHIKSGTIFMIKQGGMTCHCGIAILDGGIGQMISASLLQRKVVIEPFAQYWHDVIKVREFRGVTG